MAKDISDVLAELRTIKNKLELENVPVPKFLEFLPPEEQVDELLEIAKDLWHFHIWYKSFKLSEKYRKKGGDEG